jgi:exopolysaccharide production protein ExoY
MHGTISISALSHSELNAAGRPIGGNAALDRAATRTLNVSVALALILFFLPLMLVIAAIIVIANPGPVFFSQRRIGRGGEIFRCFKFRTMVTDAEARLAALLQNDPEARVEWARDHKLRKDPRVIGIGSFLRKSSLDELPQLFNVLRGEMSLVGPRPIVPAEIERYGRHFSAYCCVSPGITGLWQISGRNDVSYRRRVAFDVAYSRSRSVFLDIKILALTLPSVLLARGSY